MNKTPSSYSSNASNRFNNNQELGMAGLDNTQELLALLSETGLDSEPNFNINNKTTFKNKNLKGNLNIKSNKSPNKVSDKNTNKKKSFSQVLDSAKQKLDAKDTALKKDKKFNQINQETKTSQEPDEKVKLNANENLFKEIAFQAQYIQQLQQQINLNNNGAAVLKEQQSNSRLQQIINELQNAGNTNLPGDPSIELDEKNLKMNINFSPEAELQSVQVQYDPETRSVAAEIITSQEAVEVLQEQVNQLERNLAKHNIKLQSLKINAGKVHSSSGGSFSHQKHKEQQSKQS